MDLPGLRVGILPMLFRVSRGAQGLAKVMEEISVLARKMIEEDEINVLVLSDRGVNRENAPVPALLAIAGLHHYLIREGLRTRVSLVLETGRGPARCTTSPCSSATAAARSTVRGLRDHGRHDPRGPAGRRRPQDRLQELR